MGEPYATRNDVAARASQALSTEQLNRADVLLDDASAMLRERWSARIASGAVEADTLTRIVCAMVNRALLPNAGMGISSIGEGAGPFNTNTVFSNPDGNLRVTAAEAAVLDGPANGRAFTVDQWQPIADWRG